MHPPRSLGTWIAAGVVAAPLAILLHESGHALAAVARGCEEVSIRYSYLRSHDCPVASSLVIGLVYAAGPLASWLLFAAAWLATRRRLRPFFYVLAVCTAGRAAYGLVSYLPAGGATDEAVLAQLTGVPALAFVLPQLAGGLVVARWAWRHARRHQVIREAALGMGVTLASGVLYLTVLGPLLLP